MIQRSVQQVQEKYLPIIQQAVKGCETLSGNLALLEDLVVMRHGKLQVYGGRVFTNKVTGKLVFYPISDHDHVGELLSSLVITPTRAEPYRLSQAC